MSTRKRIEPVLVEVSLRNAIARRLRDHGVPEFETIAGQVVSDLTGEPVVAPPKDVPLQFHIEGVHLVWPRGLDTRVPSLHEREPFNKALKAIGRTSSRITDEDNVRVLRACYTTLWRRVCIQAAETVERMKQEGERIPEPTGPVVTTAMLNGTNPVLKAEVYDDKIVVTEVKPKRKRKTKVEPVVSEKDALTALQDDLADLRKSLEGAS